ncbi:MAG: hypothetical protein AUG83_00110 [Acidobacteria bacterium 13_1_20CM_4_57_11]|nr:MAG: hypothetical protein AUI02_03110 [Acidobacteria bacterium 13_2_20CM_2_57_12]OLE17165.1 MAG: hypothetical protein AUG83_00110 [Acidobacteria bacterium 13_1_20CM_4_57_11]
MSVAGTCVKGKDAEVNFRYGRKKAQPGMAVPPRAKDAGFPVKANGTQRTWKPGATKTKSEEWRKR